MQHIANADFVRIMTRPPYLQDGPRALDYIRSKCLVAMDTTDSQDKKEEWRAISIAKDIGANENTVMLLDAKLTAVNDQLPIADQIPGNEFAEQILRCIARGSRLFSESATAELNALEGGVRAYCEAATREARTTRTARMMSQEHRMSTGCMSVYDSVSVMCVCVSKAGMFRALLLCRT